MDQYSSYNWLLLCQSLYHPYQNSFILNHLFHDEMDNRLAAIDSIQANQIQSMQRHLYNLYIQSDSDVEKVKILQAFQVIGDRQIAMKFFSDLPAIKDNNLRSEILNFLVRFPDINKLDEVVAGHAFSEEENRLKFSAIFNLAALGKYTELLRFLDQQKNDRETFTAWMAISAHLQDLREKKEETTLDEERLSRIVKSENLLKKIILNRSKDYVNYSRESQFAYLNAYIECGERGITAITRNVLQQYDPEDKAYMLEILDVKLQQIGEKDKLLLQLLGLRINESALRERITGIFRGAVEKNLLNKKEKSGVFEYIQKFFSVQIDEYQTYFRNDVQAATPKDRLRSFLFRYGSRDLQKKILFYMEHHSGNQTLLRDIVQNFYQISHRIPAEELKYFLVHIHAKQPSIRKRIILELQSVNFDKVWLRHQILLLLSVIAQLEISGMSDKILRLYKLSQETQDRDLLIDAIKALSRLRVSAIYTDIKNFLAGNSFGLSQRELLLLLGHSTDVRAAKILLDLLQARQLASANMALAVDILGEISQAGDNAVLTMLDSLFELPDLQAEVMKA